MATTEEASLKRKGEGTNERVGTDWFTLPGWLSGQQHHTDPTVKRTFQIYFLDTFSVHRMSLKIRNGTFHSWNLRNLIRKGPSFRPLL